MGLLIGFVLKWMRTAHSITAERYFQETNILCGVSVIERGCSWSRTPGFISSGEFSSLLVSLLWDLNQLMATGEGLQRMRQTLKLAASQLTGVNIPIICFKASRLVYHSAAWLHCEKGCSQSHTQSRCDSGSCSRSPCRHASLSTAWQEQAAFPAWAQALPRVSQLRLGTWCGAAQLSTRAHGTWMLGMLSLNHSLGGALLWPVPASLLISFIFHSVFPQFILLSWLDFHSLASFQVFQQTIPSLKDWDLFLPPSQSLNSRRVTYFMHSFGLHHRAEDFKGMSNKTSLPIRDKQMFI